MLFDDYERSDMMPGFNNEATYDFLNRSRSVAAERIRTKIEKWLAQYPKEHRTDLCARLKVQFDSAFFELLIFMYLRAIGGTVHCHPIVDGSQNHPDFFVTFTNGGEAYVEAIAIDDCDDDRGGEYAAKQQVYNEINKVKSHNFFLSIDSISLLSKSQPTVRRFRAFLDRELQSRDPDIVEYDLNHGQRARIHFEDDGLDVHMTLIPKSTQYRCQPAGRLIGSYPVRTRWGDCEGEILNAIESKSSKYGKLDKSFIIAVNSLSSWGQFGNNIVSMLLGPADPNNLCLISAHPQYKRGAWFRNSGPINTRVSAVLLTKIYPWHLFSRDICLYHNPWAVRPCRVGDWGVTEVYRSNNVLQKAEGRTIADLLELEDSWPGILFD